MMEEAKDVRKRFRDESDEQESEIDSPEVKRLRDNLLDSLDDEPELCTSSQDLDSFMKSFEEEIVAGGGVVPVEVFDLVSVSGESPPDLGFLLEASDDELGLPPPTSSPGEVENGLRNELVRVESESSELGAEFWETPSYDSFGYGSGGADNFNGDYVALDGLFDYSDLSFGSDDFPWRPETLPAQ